MKFAHSDLFSRTVAYKNRSHLWKIYPANNMVSAHAQAQNI